MGLSVAVGCAYGLRLKENPRSRVFCLLGDGELNEGNVWEAAMSAAHYHLDNLIAVVDYNKVMAKGFVWDLMSIEPLVDKWTAFGWDVLEVDGHDLEALADDLLPGALDPAARQADRRDRPHRQRPRASKWRSSTTSGTPMPPSLRLRTPCCARFPAVTADRNWVTASWAMSAKRRPSMAENRPALGPAGNA